MCFAKALFPLPKQCPIPVVSRGSMVLYITRFEVAMTLLIVRKIFYVIKKMRKTVSRLSRNKPRNKTGPASPFGFAGGNEESMERKP